MGGRGANSNLQVSYGKFPYSTRFKGMATADEKKQMSNTISKIMNDAKAGNVYRLGGGFGSGSNELQIVSYNRSPNKLGIKTGKNQPVALSRENVKKYFSNGATLIKRGR